MPVRLFPRRRRWLAISGVVAVPVAIFVAVYLVFFTPDSPSKLKLTDNKQLAAGASVPTDIEGTWRVSSESQAGYRVREKLAQLPASSDAVGRTNAITGSVNIAKTSTGVQCSGATFEVDVSQLKSDESRRDNRIRTMGLQTDQFPKATFVSTTALTLPSSALSGQQLTTNAVGDLTMHGVTKQVTIPLQVQLINGKVEVVGSLQFPWADFGMQAPSVGPFVTVQSDPTLEFKLVLEHAPSA